MEIKLKRDDLLKPLSKVAGVVEKRQSLPILSCILMKTDSKQLVMTGTDLEVEVVSKLGVNDGDPGDLAVPARKLLDICRALPAEADISIKQEGEKAVVRSGKSRFTLATMSAEDFPGVETSDWSLETTIPQTTLKHLLEKTQFCMANQDVRYYLNGLLLEISGKEIRAVATDGHRMAMSTAELGDAAKQDWQAIIPRKGIIEIIRFLEDEDQNVTMRLGSNHAQFEMGDVVFTTKLIDGRFPDYNKVIPQTQPKKLLLERQSFRDALNRVAILSNEKYRGVRFSLSPGELKITAHNPDQEEAVEEIGIDYSSEELEIGFNVNYISEAAGVMHGDKIEITLNDPNSSCTLSQPEDKSTLYVVMPMRL
ncbi:MAG: DNA polymerase III subunit beta [Acidiferrobacterales bacterium]